jgi:hypothetical protein
LCVATFSAGKNVQENGTLSLTFDVMKIQGAMAMNSTLVITNTGLYWLHLSAGVPPSTQCEIRIKGLAFVPDLIRAHSTYNLIVDTISRDGIIPLTNGDKLTLSSTYPLASDGLLQTGFRWLQHW